MSLVQVGDARRLARPPWRRPGRAAGAERRRQAGIALCLVHAAGFGALPIFGKAAIEAGMGPIGLLWTRFGLAALVFWGLVAAVRPARPATRWLVAGLAMGFGGYAVEATLFFLALERIDASLTELLLYAYPAMVTAAAVGLGRERLTLRLAGALLLASGGLVAILAASLTGSVNLAGFALGLSAAAVYSGYVLAGERVVTTVHPLLLAALVATGAAAFFTLAGGMGAPLQLPDTGSGWVSVALIAVVSTVVPVAALFAGIERVGAPTASIISTAEPVLTVALAMLFLGEALSPAETLGAGAILAAVRLLQSPAAERRAGEERGDRTGGTGLPTPRAETEPACV